MKIGAVKILVNECQACETGVYLRWWFNGWHYWNFLNGYQMTIKTESMGTQTMNFFSVISKIERPTRLKSEYSYKITLEGIQVKDIGAFNGLLMAEKVEQYVCGEAGSAAGYVPFTADTTLYSSDSTLETADMTYIESSIEGMMSGTWYEVDIQRGEHLIREVGSPGYILNFEIRRKELPELSTVYHKTLRLYLGDTLCDLDADEVIPINKQVNDIAEMQDRQSDFTAQFRVRKTREMKALFELSGEIGVNTTFPFEEKSCRLISDNIEVITDGRIILDRVDDQYYYVSILSGNKNFFRSLDGLKITDLDIDLEHTWDLATMVGTHAADGDYVYPLCEPSDDGGIAPLTDNGDSVNMYGGWIWCFVKVRTIWDKIFTDSGYTAEGDIFDYDIFDKLHLPIVSRETTKSQANKYLYSMYWVGNRMASNGDALGNDSFPGTMLFNGTAAFKEGYYYFPYDGTYKISVYTMAGGFPGGLPTLSVHLEGMYDGNMTLVSSSIIGATYEYEIDGIAGQHITVHTTAAMYHFYNYAIVDIKDPAINYGSTFNPISHLPALGQTDFIKMICNMFGLIPDVNTRDRKIKFWNYSTLYDNITIARDWSAYLSERDDEVEFKFGDYAQNNYLRYKESKDTLADQGTGIMKIDDDTLPETKDGLELPVSTCDEVTILDSVEFGVNVSRIAFNKWKYEEGATFTEDNYESEKTIDPRVVVIDNVKEIASPPYEKELELRVDVDRSSASTRINSPKKASSIECSFSYLVAYYASLSRMLTNTNLRRAKFNLPVYEVAGLKHYVPIYLSQYKAYFYVNKINNYVPGQLTTIDLIKL